MADPRRPLQQAVSNSSFIPTTWRLKMQFIMLTNEESGDAVHRVLKYSGGKSLTRCSSGFHRIHHRG